MNPSQRLLPIDAVRGTVTFFVGVSHISYFFIVSKPLFFGVLRRRRLGKPVAPRPHAGRFGGGFMPVSPVFARRSRPVREPLR
jgi:hypothetical protein